MLRDKQNLCIKSPAVDFLSPEDPESFTVDRVLFSTVVQYFVYSKAMLSGDRETARKILDEHDPFVLNGFSRVIRDFDEPEEDAAVVNWDLSEDEIQEAVKAFEADETDESFFAVEPKWQDFSEIVASMNRVEILL